jgi:hypothetical protein
LVRLLVSSDHHGVLKLLQRRIRLPNLHGQNVPARREESARNIPPPMMSWLEILVVAQLRARQEALGAATIDSTFDHCLRPCVEDIDCYQGILTRRELCRPADNLSDSIDSGLCAALIPMPDSRAVDLKNSITPRLAADAIYTHSLRSLPPPAANTY